MQNPSFNAVLGLTLAALAGCGATTPNADRACADMAAARCKEIQRCESNAIATGFGDLPTCQAREHDSCVKALAASGTGVSPSSTEDCANVFTSISCTDYLNNTLPPVCQAKAGALAMGAGCAFPSQCQSRFCNIPKNGACGSCAPLPAVGDSCAQMTQCGPGLKCVDGGMTCASVASTTGDTCDKDDPCSAGFSCVGAKPNATPVVEGTCQPAVQTPGAPCDPKKQTSAGCDANLGLTCDATTMTCVTITVAAPGSPCDGASIVCGGGGTCSTGATQICMAAAVDGTACDTVNGPGCLNPARCVVSGTDTTGLCALLTDVGCD
jgi:hypothetical protein